jgi:opacity protein-like surface antigen
MLHPMEVFVKPRTVTTLVFSAMLALVAAMPAAAQSQDNVPAAPAFQINASFLPDQTPPAAGEAISFDDQARGAAPTTHTMGDRQIFVRVEGGLVFCCSNTGFMVGVGVSGQPKSVKNLEVAGDFGFGRLFGTNLIYIAADGLYDFHMKGHDAMPYAGAGLGIVHAGGVTKTAFQILGGVQLPVTGPHVARVEVRFIFFSAATTTLLLGSYSF